MWRKRWDKRAEIDLNRPEIEMEKIRPNSSLKQSLNKFKISSKRILFPSRSLIEWLGGEVFLWVNVYCSQNQFTQTKKHKKTHKVSVPLLLDLYDVSMPYKKKAHIVFLHAIEVYNSLHAKPFYFKSHSNTRSAASRRMVRLTSSKAERSE